jgi:hypothetical protein
MRWKNLFILQKNGEGDLVVMSIEAFEKREQLLKLKAKLTIAEKLRLSGEPTVSLEETKKRLEEKYKNAGV